MTAAVRVALLVALLLVSSSAAAADAGLPVGDLVFKPGVRVGFVYDSNVRSSATGPQPDIGIEAQPYLGIVYGGENFRWDFSVHYRLLKYANLNGSNHDAHSTFTTFGLRSVFDANRKGKVGFYFAPAVDNRLVRTGSESSSDGPPGGGGQTGSDYVFGLAAPIEVRLRPTKALTVTPKFRYDLARYYFPIAPFAPDPGILGQSHLLDGGLGFDWRFFPRSHLVIDLTGGYKHWQTEVVSPDLVGSLGSQLPAGHFRALAGLRGDISRKLSILLLAGYGSSFTIGNDALSLPPAGGILGRFELGIRPVTTQRLAFGFTRDFSNPYYAQWQVDTQGYFKYKGLWFGRLGTQVDVAYIFRNLGGLSGGTVARDEHQITAGVLIEVMIAEWFHIDASYRFGAIPTTTTNTAEYIDSRVLVGLTLGFK